MQSLPEEGKQTETNNNAAYATNSTQLSNQPQPKKKQVEISGAVDHNNLNDATKNNDVILKKKDSATNVHASLVSSTTAGLHGHGAGGQNNTVKSVISQVNGRQLGGNHASVAAN